MKSILEKVYRFVLKKKRKKKRTLKKKTRKKTKKLVEERKLAGELAIVKAILKVKEEDKEDDKKEEGDSLDNKLASDGSFRDKQPDSTEDNSYGKRGASGSSVYLFGGSSTYTDYNKIWGFLGEFKTKGVYKFAQFEEKRLKETPLVIPSTEGILCDLEVIEDCVKHQKYFTAGDNMNGTYGLVPFGKVNSKDWEKFKMWAMVEYVLYKLYMDRM